VTANLMKVAVLEREPGGIYDRMIAAERERGWRSGIGPLLEWDTRDHLFAPSRGTWIQLRALYYRDWLGSDFEFEERAIDVRHYRALAPRHILAGQALAVRHSGQIPLGDYPSLGDALRGVLDGRYNDRALLMGQVEYRYPLWRRLGGVLFAGLGDVNDRLGHMAAREMKFAAGAGLRFMIDPEERLSVRMDVGFSREGSQFYLQFSEAF
jgi:outer membrane protein assembly factor BamA